MRVQIATAHETSLCGVGVYPAEDHELLGIAIIEEVAFVGHLARVACARLRGYDQSCYEQGVGFQDAAKYAASFKITCCVGRSSIQKEFAEL